MKAVIEALCLKHSTEGRRLEVEVEVLSDSCAARGAIMRAGPGPRMKHLHANTLFVQQYVNNGDVKVSAIEGEKNPVGLGTKALANEKIVSLLSLMNCFFVGRGEAEFSLALAGATSARIWWYNVGPFAFAVDLGRFDFYDALRALIALIVAYYLLKYLAKTTLEQLTGAWSEDDQLAELPTRKKRRYRTAPDDGKAPSALIKYSGDASSIPCDNCQLHESRRMTHQATQSDYTFKWWWKSPQLRCEPHAV